MTAKIFTSLLPCSFSCFVATGHHIYTKFIPYLQVRKKTLSEKKGVYTF